MNLKNIKTVAALACSLGLTLSSLYAGSCSSNKDKDDQAAQRRQMMNARRSKKNYENNMSEQKTSGDWGVKMAAAHGCSWNEGFVVTLDYLLMRSYQPALAYAFETKNVIKGVYTSPNAQGVLSKGKMIRPNRTWRPGFKVGLGWNTPYDMWDMKSEWMYYYNKSVTNKSADPMLLTSFANTEEGLYPYWATAFENATRGTIPTNSSGVPRYTQLQGTWLLNYNMIKCELGRSIYLTKAVALRPHVGVQNGWIHQKSDITYVRSFNEAPAETDANNVDQLVKIKNKFWGLGLCSGLDGEWKLGYGFSFLGKLAAALLSGRTNSSKSQYSSINNPQLGDLGSSSYTEIYRDTDRIRHLSPGLDCALGLNWGSCMGTDSMYLGFSINWESMYWWNQFHYLRPSAAIIDVEGDNENYRELHLNEYPEVNDGALNIEGLTVRAKFDF